MSSVLLFSYMMFLILSDLKKAKKKCVFYL